MSTLQEWKEIQEEKKDYSNLKIGQLSMHENNQFVHHHRDSDNDGDDNEGGNERSSGADPWSKKDPSSSGGDVVAAPQVQESSRATASASKLYISPALRASANNVSIFQGFIVLVVSQWLGFVVALGVSLVCKCF